MKDGQTNEPETRSPVDRSSVSRRTLLRNTGIAMGARFVPGLAYVRSPEVESVATGAAATQEDLPRTLSQGQFLTLDAICARLIPTDSNGPGARQARAVRYIDRALSGALASAQRAYREGIAALDTYSRESKGARFVDLDENGQDQILADLEDGQIDGAPPGFFDLLRSHTIQGTFSDPFYGGNAGFVGWDMIGYPGVRVAVPSEFQQIGPEHPPNHQSVYEASMFEPGED